MGLAINGHSALAHGLQQGRLRLGRGAVDFIRQQYLRENRPLGQSKGIGLKIEQIGSQHVARHHVRRELDAPELQIQPGGKGLDKKGLAGARHAFQQDVSAAQQAGQQQFNGLFLADDDLADFGSDGVNESVHVFQRHAVSPLSIDACFRQG